MRHRYLKSNNVRKYGRYRVQRVEIISMRDKCITITTVVIRGFLAATDPDRTLISTFSTYIYIYTVAIKTLVR